MVAKKKRRVKASMHVRPTPKWEYATETLTILKTQSRSGRLARSGGVDARRLQTMLAQRGRERWELVAQITVNVNASGLSGPVPQPNMMFIFKRRL